MPMVFLADDISNIIITYGRNGVITIVGGRWWTPLVRDTIVQYRQRWMDLRRTTIIVSYIINMIRWWWWLNGEPIQVGL